MSTETVRSVEKWYAENQPRPSPHCSLLKMESNTPDDTAHGGIWIAAVAAGWLGSICFWNKGDVTSMMVHRATRNEKILMIGFEDQGRVWIICLNAFFEHLLSEQ